MISAQNSPDAYVCKAYSVPSRRRARFAVRRRRHLRICTCFFFPSHAIFSPPPATTCCTTTTRATLHK